jgi:hypothetical protein
MLGKIRNLKCPCGSGKKFKRCCYSRYVIPSNESTVKAKKEHKKIEAYIAKRFRAAIKSRSDADE